MPSIYTTEEALEDLVGEARLLALLDRDRDGMADAGILDRAIQRAGRIIDRRLRQRYGSALPFASVPDTPASVQEIAADIVLWHLYAYYEPDGRDAQEHQAMAHEALEALRKGEDDIPVPRAKAHEGAVIAVVAPGRTVFVGSKGRGI